MGKSAWSYGGYRRSNSGIYFYDVKLIFSVNLTRLKFKRNEPERLDFGQCQDVLYSMISNQLLPSSRLGADIVIVFAFRPFVNAFNTCFGLFTAFCSIVEWKKIKCSTIGRIFFFLYSGVQLKKKIKTFYKWMNRFQYSNRNFEKKHTDYSIWCGSAKEF